MALVDIAATFEDNLLKNDELEDLISEDLRYRDKQLLRLKMKFSTSKTLATASLSPSSLWMTSDLNS